MLVEEFSIGRPGDGNGDTDVQLKRSLTSEHAVWRLQEEKFGDKGIGENREDKIEIKGEYGWAVERLEFVGKGSQVAVAE
jgi:hypothetical protein